MVLLSGHLIRQGGVDGVSGLLSIEMTDDRVSDERNVSKEIQQFVPDEFVRKTKVVVYDSGVIEYNRVLQRSAANQSAFPEIFHIRHKPESPCRTDLAAV